MKFPFAGSHAHSPNSRTSGPGVTRLPAEPDDEVTLPPGMQGAHRHVRVEPAADDGLLEDALEARNDFVEPVAAGRTSA